MHQYFGTRAEIDQILDRHGIAPSHYEDFYKLAETGGVQKKSFQQRLRLCVHYRKAADELTALYRTPRRPVFAPPYFESLNLNDFPPSEPLYE